MGAFRFSGIFLYGQGCRIPRSHFIFVLFGRSTAPNEIGEFPASRLRMWAPSSATEPVMKKFFPLALLLAALPAIAQDVAALTAETKKTVLPVVPKVVNAMQEAVAAKGVAGAIPVCKDEAPKLVKEKRDETGWAIRRVSLKTRNPERATPDLWEARQLADFNIRAANGEKLDMMEKSEIVTIDGKQVFRYMKALPVADVCLNCHGPADKLDAGLKAELGKYYPHDQATGYAKGQIRGALTVKRPL
jgi:hypothetical protein